MVTITEQEVTEALHLSSTSDLPTGASSDIATAEELVGAQVEPYTSESLLVERCAIYVACAFITGSEGEGALSQIQRDTATISYDTEGVSDESVDYWMRARAVDPTGRLGSSHMDFEVF